MAYRHNERQRGWRGGRGRKLYTLRPSNSQVFGCESESVHFFKKSLSPGHASLEKQTGKNKCSARFKRRKWKVMKEKTKAERRKDNAYQATAKYISVITPWHQSYIKIYNRLCSRELIKLNLIFPIKHYQLDFLRLLRNPISLTNYSSLLRSSLILPRSPARSSHNDETRLQDIWRKRSMGGKA